MIQVVNYNNEFVRVTLTKSERVDLDTLKKVFRDVIKVCDGQKLPVKVDISKQTTLEMRTRKYFKKLESMKFVNSMKLNWYGCSSVNYSEEEALLVSAEVKEYFSF